MNREEFKEKLKKEFIDDYATTDAEVYGSDLYCEFNNYEDEETDNKNLMDIYYGSIIKECFNEFIDDYAIKELNKKYNVTIELTEQDSEELFSYYLEQYFEKTVEELNDNEYTYSFYIVDYEETAIIEREKIV